jgi:hypothetical protein
MPGCTSVITPSRVITRLSRTTVRYGGFSQTRSSRSGTNSSRAVARRITPDRCTAPVPSTYPRGNSNGNSVRGVSHRAATGAPGPGAAAPQNVGDRRGKGGGTAHGLLDLQRLVRDDQFLGQQTGVSPAFNELISRLFAQALVSLYRLSALPS